VIGAPPPALPPPPPPILVFLYILPMYLVKIIIIFSISILLLCKINLLSSLGNKISGYKGSALC
jgi:hypothetical protein